MCAGLLFSAQYLSDSVGDINQNPNHNNTIENATTYYPSPDPTSLQQVSLNKFSPTNLESGINQHNNANPQVSTEDKPPEQHFINMLANLMINFILQDQNVDEDINNDSDNSNEIIQNNTEVSSLNYAINAAEESDYYELLKEAPMTDEQLKEIQAYSGGKSPTEIVDEFCKEVDSGELHLMTEDIRQSYNYNPASPAILMSAFEKMGNLCP
jgi:hypothetical protein